MYCSSVTLTFAFGSKKVQPAFLLCPDYTIPDGTFNQAKAGVMNMNSSQQAQIEAYIGIGVQI